MSPVQGGGGAHLAQQEGEVQDHRTQGKPWQQSVAESKDALSTLHDVHTPFSYRDLISQCIVCERMVNPPLFHA